jgi:DNA primase
MKGNLVASVMLSQSLRESLERAVSRYEAHVDLAAPYLVARGITEQTAHTYRLGYVLDPARGDDEYVGRLVIPYLNTAGVVDVRYRALHPGEEPKYKSRPGASVRLFSVKSLMQPGDSIVICEGELDAMTVNQIGVPAVGVPGANAWKDHWRLLFADYDNVIVCCDGDQAGRDFGRRVAERVDNVQVVHLPDGLDVNDVFVQQGEAALRERIGL